MFGQAALMTVDEKTVFYNALFSKASKYIEVRLIDKHKNVTGRHFMTFDELKTYSPPMDQNVYIGLFDRNKRNNGKLENCFKTNCLWADFDGMQLEEIHYRIEMSKLPTPSMIVNSGHGFHVYWILNKATGHEVQPILKAIAEKLQADPKATDIPRILRVPGTNNVKESPVVPCTIEQADNGLRVSVKQFESILGVKAQIEHIERTGAIKELSEVTFNGLHNMATGVSKGERNFCTGRIVQTLKRLNYTKREVENIVIEWNKLNGPAKSSKELLHDIKTYWHREELKFEGKEFSDDKLQELNERFIDSKTTFFKSDITNYVQYDNELLHPERFKKIGGLTFVILSIIKLKGDKGIRREHLADLCNRNPLDKKLTGGLKDLEKLGYLDIKKQNKTFFYYYKEKPIFKRGFTSVPSLLDEVYLGKRITENEYKLMIILESYAFDNKREVFPTNRVLAYRMGVTEQTIKTNLKKLKHKIYIDTEFKKGNRYIILLRGK